jgi:hypothetical protein
MKLEGARAAAGRLRLFSPSPVGRWASASHTYVSVPAFAGSAPSMPKPWLTSGVARQVRHTRQIRQPTTTHRRSPPVRSAGSPRASFREARRREIPLGRREGKLIGRDTPSWAMSDNSTRGRSRAAAATPNRAAPRSVRTASPSPKREMRLVADDAATDCRASHRR